MSNTHRTDVAEHNMGSVLEPHYVVDVDCSRQLERELAEAKAQRDLAVEALKIIGECLIMKVKFSENATAAITASMIKKVLKECGK